MFRKLFSQQEEDYTPLVVKDEPISQPEPIAGYKVKDKVFDNYKKAVLYAYREKITDVINKKYNYTYISSVDVERVLEQDALLDEFIDKYREAQPEYSLISVTPPDGIVWAYTVGIDEENDMGKSINDLYA